MEVREKYIARLLNDPIVYGFSETKFIHMPQIITSNWVRQRCQYVCRHVRQSDFTPPFSPGAADTQKMLDEFRFGLILRKEVSLPFEGDFMRAWSDFEQAMVESETQAFQRGYGKAFAIGAGNCLFCHHDDSLRPCEFNGKSRPTLEAIGINLHDTLDMVGWDQYLVRSPEEPFQMFGVLLLE